MGLSLVILFLSFRVIGFIVLFQVLKPCLVRFWVISSAPFLETTLYDKMYNILTTVPAPPSLPTDPMDSFSEEEVLYMKRITLLKEAVDPASPLAMQWLERMEAMVRSSTWYHVRYIKMFPDRRRSRCECSFCFWPGEN